MIAKYKIHFVCVLILFSFATCKKDNFDLIGNWRVTSVLSENCNSPADNSFLLLGGFKCENQLPYCTQANIVFNEDGNYTFSITAIIDNVEDIDTWTGTYNVLDETIEICNGTCDNLTIEDEYLVLSFFREGSGCDIEWKFIKEE